MKFVSLLFFAILSAQAAPLFKGDATTLNAATVSLIKHFEGFVSKPAPDPIGLPTVGFGHLCKTKNCGEVPFSFPLSQASASTLLNTDAKTFVNCLHGMIKNSVKLNDNQFGALTSFAFNLGCGAVQSSTMLKRLNAGESPDTVAAQEMPKFNHAGGKVLQGLTTRRTAEVALFKTASNTIAHPLC
ncbi:family 24 glycoside hydrolase [Hysterangium stoloniferum]|nr:family 24 glycoside hydrolase [Hysterangium stoloniferum]